jgi:hypothetical protein
MALLVNEARLFIEFKAIPQLVDYTAHLLLRQECVGCQIECVCRRVYPSI